MSDQDLYKTTRDRSRGMVCVGGVIGDVFHEGFESSFWVRRGRELVDDFVRAAPNAKLVSLTVDLKNPSREGLSPHDRYESTCVCVTIRGMFESSDEDVLTAFDALDVHSLPVILEWLGRCLLAGELLPRVES